MGSKACDHAAREQTAATFVIVLRLTPAFSRELSHTGVLEAVAAAAATGSAPDTVTLIALGQCPDFASVFVQRLQYLMDLKKAGILRAAGPFEGQREGMYLCTAPDEHAARRVIEEDPLYVAGLIEEDYRIERWLVAI
jgi:uncharacterized protein YciI